MFKQKYNYLRHVFFVLSFAFIVGHVSGKQTWCLYHPAPVVNFEISHFCLGDTAHFTNTSQLGTSYLWNIYEVENGPKGTVIDSLVYTSTDFNINFLFPNSGHYIIELTGFNGHTVTITRDVIIDSLTTANFDYVYCGSKFENMSVCYNSCLWDFGDGHTSTEDSPVHFYDSLGVTYSVKLITYNVNSTDTFTNDIFANSPNNLDATFKYIVNKDSVLFMANDSVSGPFTQYHWSFGDGAVADLYTTNGGRKIYHTYLKKDTTYTVFLLAKTTCLSAFGQVSIFLVDSTPVTSTNIYPNPVSGNSLLNITTERKAELKEIHITDCLGKLIDDYAIIETFKGFNIDVSNFAMGVYFLKLNFSDNTLIKKIIKE
ncbi:MAG: T9SS type A sorting domain-containing protein [Bacteroidetes bacterium]|nr:T9SS type A sorting domain-containing protein [Bacteroidota bacterium]